MEVLSNFKEIVVEKPADKIIKQIKELISSGQLKPGDKLPPERQLCEKLGVGRSYVRDAIRKLEFYGIVKTLPQSGTVVAGLGITALEGLITDVLMVEGHDFHSLIETRLILEKQTVRLAAMRRTEEDLADLERALEAYRTKVKNGKQGIEEDLMFHIRIAEASKNSVLKSLMLIVTPDILTHFTQQNVCGGGRPYGALEEHMDILEYIRIQDPDKAEAAMSTHLKDVVNFKS
ncbi:FadR family transcriptional regulator [Pontibacter sp. JH31]|uniref:FadR family transcriptional regulator n=1 Tax=Pontibacter aquaedesilientis TaxID=2766980 RepID=A0ABR7XEI0_9BACT|nr:FadR/GntR family transcriptional regulator [Pontibacter aquaedesilientis]MBD1395786.1 FadR family transcriptional regulator [Pontibacter aquaedesilientis]